MDSIVQELQLRLRVLEDIEAIRDLKARYWRALDRQDPQAVRDCLAPDVQLDMEGVPSRGREDYLAFIREAGCRPGLCNLHAGQNARIRRVGDDSAEGEWDVLFTSVDVRDRLTIRMSVDYLDRYVRRDGRWWIAAMRTRQTSFLMQQIGGDGAVNTLSLGQGNAAAFGG